MPELLLLMHCSYGLFKFPVEYILCLPVFQEILEPGKSSVGTIRTVRYGAGKAG